MSNRFRGNYLEIIPTGISHLVFSRHNEHYTWTKARRRRRRMKIRLKIRMKKRKKERTKDDSMMVIHFIMMNP
jgi:hypothetical protein